MSNPWLTSSLLLTSVALIGAAVDHWATPVLGPPMERNGYGRASVSTGPLAYPREAVDADGFRVVVPRQPVRLASQYWSIDDYLYSVVPAERVVAVSDSSYLRDFSNVYGLVEKFKPVLAGDAERVLRASPDLILVSSASRSDFTSLMRSSGIPVYRMFIDFTTLQQIEEYVRVIGYLTGEDGHAAEVAARFHADVERARAMRPAGAARPRVLGMSGMFTYGANTLFDDIVKTVGGVNPAAEAGLKGYDVINSEQLARWNPEWIITGANVHQMDEMRRRVLADPGVALTEAGRKGHVLVLDNRVFLPMSPFASARVTAMAEALWN